MSAAAGATIAGERFRKWRLVRHDEAASVGAGLRIVREPQVVGSSARCSLPISSGLVAPRHAEIWSGPSGPLLRDLGSEAGTFVNSRRIDAPWRLCCGDLVQFGDADFRLIEEFGARRVAASPPRLSLHGRPIVRLDDPRTLVAFDLVGKLEIGAWRDPKPVHVGARGLCRTAGVAEKLEHWVDVHSGTGGERPAIVLHAAARELLNFGLHHDLCQLRDDAPSVSFIVQIHQSAFDDVESTRALQLVVHSLDMQLACTGFTERPSRLSTFRLVAPDFICINADDLGGDCVDGRLATQVAKQAKEAGIQLIARGMATTGQLQACQAVGVELGGGPLFGALRPID